MLETTLARRKAEAKVHRLLYNLSMIYVKVLFICFIENGLLMLLNAELGGG